MSQPSAYSSYPPDLTEKQSEFLASQIKDWSISHGLAYRPSIAYTESDARGNYVGAAPITLFPSLFPLDCFEEALSLQPAYNEVYARIASDEQWLGSVVEELAGVDSFIARLWRTHLSVKKEGYKQNLSLGLFRSDYMAHLPPGQEKATIRQVEFNTMASGMGGLSSRVTSLHRHLLQTASYPDEASSTVNPDVMPDNDAVDGMGKSMLTSHKAYGPSKSGKPTCIIFVVQDQERNAFDQRLIEYSTASHAGTQVFRVPFKQILLQTTLDNDRNLIYTPPSFQDRHYEVTTVYYRAGYSPTEYTNEEAWHSRLHIERSSAIKCPSILLHLAGCKKVQQILASPGSPHLARFMGDEDVIYRLKNTFAPMYPMDASPAGLRGRELATNPKTASRFVLKPQREGGGNNVYRTAIPKFLEMIPRSQWSAYILMEMIEPPAQKNTILRDGEVEKGDVICELGVFGAVLWDQSEENAMQILANHEIGHLLRTKGDQCEEGGISAGLGALDSVCLVDV